MCASSGSEIRKLFSKACKEALNPSEQQTLSSQLETDPKLVYQIGLTPQKVSKDNMMVYYHYKFQDWVGVIVRE